MLVVLNTFHGARRHRTIEALETGCTECDLCSKNMSEAREKLAQLQKQTQNCMDQTRKTREAVKKVSAAMKKSPKKK